MVKRQICPICKTKWSVTWQPMIEHDDCQTCLCGYVLAT